MFFDTFGECAAHLVECHETESEARSDLGKIDEFVEHFNSLGVETLDDALFLLTIYTG